MSYCLYKHTCPNGKVYIGITNQNPLRRWNCGRGYKTQILFYRAIQKYGWNNIKHEILFDKLTKELACKKEIDIISQYNSNNHNYGYNISSGGKGSNGITPSKETRQKISEAMKGKNTWQRGRNASDETRKKIGQALIGHIGWTKGKHLGIEQKNRISKSLSKNVFQYSTDGVFIKEWDSLTTIQSILKISSGHISEVCCGKRKTAGGYFWRYAK